MTIPRIDIYDELEKMALPAGEYIVLGSGILGALGIREIEDIDLLVSPRLFNALRDDGWSFSEVEIDGRIRKRIHHGHCEAFEDFWYGDTHPDPMRMISEAESIRGLPFLSLEKLAEIKKAWGREKDRKDIVLIQDYLENHVRND